MQNSCAISYSSSVRYAMYSLTATDSWCSSRVLLHPCEVPVSNQFHFSLFNSSSGVKISTLSGSASNRSVSSTDFLNVCCASYLILAHQLIGCTHLQLFEKVRVSKPGASLSRSAEFYFVCLEYKAPAKIQPELFDLKHLFTVSLEKNKVRWNRSYLLCFSYFLLGVSLNVAFCLGCSLGMKYQILWRQDQEGRYSFLH